MADLIPGLEAALKIVEANGRPGPGGINITDGIPSPIYVAIGRGYYEDSNEYGVAEDTANTVRTEIADMIRRAINEFSPAPGGGR